MTTYDTYGRPQQTVDPGVAIAGVAAAGLVGYALANDGGGRRYNTTYSSTHYDSGYGGYGGGYGGYDDHCY